MSIHLIIALFQIINYVYLSHLKIFSELMKKFTTTTLNQTRNYTSLVSKQTSEDSALVLKELIYTTCYQVI